MEKPYDEHRLCGPNLPAQLADLLQAIVIDKVHTVIRRQTLGSSLAQQLIDSGQII